MIDACSYDSKPLLTLEQALENIKATIEPVQDSEIVTLKNALGRVLSEPVYSPINIPYDRNAAMDGYAFSSARIKADEAFTLELSGTSWAGRPFQGQMQTGQCVRIYTGAVVPEQADSVIMQEHVKADGQIIHFPADSILRQNIRAVGEDVKQGACLINSPKKMTVYDIGLLASAGISELTVRRRLKIIFFSTGDELNTLGQPLAPGKIYDSNRYLLAGFLADAGYSIVDGGLIPDNKQLLEDTLLKASQNADVIITTGGASAGEADYVKEVLQSCGQVSFWKIAIKPGKPMAFGKIGGSYFFGLPGNPVAVVATFQQLVVPALRQLAGGAAERPLRFKAICTSFLKKTAGRQEFQRGILTTAENGEFFVTSSGRQGSHMLSSMSRSNCFIVLPAECEGIKAGESVLVEPFGVFVNT